MESSREYRITPELWRSCWYALFGFVFLTAVAFWIHHVILQKSVLQAVLVSAGSLSVSVAMIVPLLWRVRIDQYGISRRIIFWWDSWPWSTLASGRIRKLHPITLYDPDRPWWCRKMRLNYIDIAERDELMTAINGRYKLPPPPEIPPTLQIKYRFRHSAIFDYNGIHLTARRELYEYPWQAVRSVRIVRIDSLRRDFSSLAVEIPDQTIELKLLSHEGGASPTWRGATAEEVNEFLFKHVPNNRIEVSIADHKLTSREQVLKKLQETKEQIRVFTIVTPIFVPLLVIALVGMAIDDGISKALFMTAVSIVFPGSVVVFVFRGLRKKIAELTELLNSMPPGA